MAINEAFSELKKSLEGDLFFDDASRLMYATDASAYREMPLAVARPKTMMILKRSLLLPRKIKFQLFPEPRELLLPDRL